MRNIGETNVKNHLPEMVSKLNTTLSCVLSKLVSRLSEHSFRFQDDFDFLHVGPKETHQLDSRTPKDRTNLCVTQLTHNIYWVLSGIIGSALHPLGVTDQKLVRLCSMEASSTWGCLGQGTSTVTAGRYSSALWVTATLRQDKLRQRKQTERASAAALFAQLQW